MMSGAPADADQLTSLPIPPLSSSIFSNDLTLPDDFFSFDAEDFDITFDDIHLPSDTEDLFNSVFNTSNRIDLSSDHEFNDFVTDHGTVIAESGKFSENHSSDVSGFLNIPSPDKSGERFIDETVRILENSSPEPRSENPVSSQGSGNCGSAGSEAAMNFPSPDSGNSVVDQNVKRQSGSNFVLKRKKGSCDGNSNETSATTENSNQIDEKDEKKKARLIRNRESAQLSRQRKKHYVEELEDKVRSMQSTIQDLNARIAYFAAENATLKQQMVAGGGGVCSPPVMYTPHPAMAPMGYPWMPYPPYVVKSQGSQVPLVPIPRLKPKKSDVKKTEDTTKTKTKTKTKIKKVASISFLGLLLCIVLFAGLVPIMNVKFDGVTDSGYSISGVSTDYKFYNKHHHGKVLIGDDHVNLTNHSRVHEPLVASLYVPRNDKLVKIDGNLIIHSVLASEKAMATMEEQGMIKNENENTGLAVARDLVPAKISVPAVGRNSGRQPRMYTSLSDRERALASVKENLKPKHVDGKLQQWFREGLAGPMLTSGTCTEVFQFDISIPSSSGTIIPTTPTTANNSTYITTVKKNRRILRGLPIPLVGPTINVTKEQVAAGHDHKNGSVSSTVVSVLVDPREAGEGDDVDGVMMGGGKSFSRIFVVVLLDSVKYVTYSCMVPMKGASNLINKI